ncbi:hypothetical protein NGRA_0677 [Nosema granulosis]|uniref:Uncharacterized protein n=1 Tax=Nosema granulosis TaxID=83296 RepID=A0A9P6H0F1_9MICR|nr:hypothetical protein NGRA_0677 [Nosema granulosis]
MHIYFFYFLLLKTANISTSEQNELNMYNKTQETQSGEEKDNLFTKEDQDKIFKDFDKILSEPPVFDFSEDNNISLQAVNEEKQKDIYVEDIPQIKKKQKTPSRLRRFFKLRNRTN